MTSTVLGSIPKAASLSRWAALALAVVLAGCASPQKYRAPVEDRSVFTRPAAAPATAAY